MLSHAPDIETAKRVTERYLNDIRVIERVPKGRSTYVYRVVARAGTYYLRFLPEEGSFASEVLAHRLMREVGVRVPNVIAFEHKEPDTSLSFMLVDEIAGVSIEDDRPQSGLRVILRCAGRQLALIHNIPVDGFGWIDRRSYDALKGGHGTFDAYFCEHLRHDLETLHRYPFTDGERTRIADLMESARRLLNIKKAVLIHGDFDISHIFHSQGKYTGIIDFGEIRGCNPLFDLATFIGFYKDQEMYSYLLEGYQTEKTLTEENKYAVELMALFILLRFLGKKAGADSHSHWFESAKRQLHRINRI